MTSALPRPYPGVVVPPYAGDEMCQCRRAQCVLIVSGDYCMAMVEKRHLDDLRRVSYTQGRRCSVSCLLFVE
jgi:hypothetical protein